jgi:hypothetical protein
MCNCICRLLLDEEADRTQEFDVDINKMRLYWHEPSRGYAITSYVKVRKFAERNL